MKKSIFQIWIIWGVFMLLSAQARHISSEDIKLRLGGETSFGSIDAKIVKFGGYSTPECTLAISLDGRYFYLNAMHSNCWKGTNRNGVKIICNYNKSVCKTRRELIDFIQNGSFNTSRPSWCNDAHLNRTERTICSNPSLSKLDKELAQVYRSVKARIGSSGQKRWLINERNSCGSNVSCLLNAYKNRIAQLRGEDNINTSRPNWCNDAHLNRTERTICSNPSLSKLDKELAQVYHSVKARIGSSGQKRWLINERNSCGSNVSCLLSAYKNRIAQLREEDDTDKETNSNNEEVDIKKQIWKTFKDIRKDIALRYKDLKFETINKMAKSDTLKKFNDYNLEAVEELINLELGKEYLEFSKTKDRYNEYQNSIPTKNPKLWDKLVKYDIIFNLRLSVKEYNLISKYNPAGIMNSLYYLDDCAYDKDCYMLASNLTVLHSKDYVKEEKLDISEAEFKIINQLIIKFLERDCQNELDTFLECSDYEKNKCSGFGCEYLGIIYSGAYEYSKYYANYKNVDRALYIAKEMCENRDNARNCSVLGTIYISKGTNYYQEAKKAFRKGCELTKKGGNVCLNCCENYQDLIDKGW